MKNQRLICIFLLILSMTLGLLPLSGQAAEETRVVRVGYESYPNYEEGGEGEFKRGYGYEYLQRVAYRTGWKYEYVYGGFPALLEMLERGEIDLLGNVTSTPERAERMLFSQHPQGEESFGIYTIPGSGKVISRMAMSLRDRKIGYIETDYQRQILENWLEESEIACTIVPYLEAAQMLEDLDSGRIDAIMDTDTSLGRGYVLVTELSREHFYFAVSKNKPELLFELNRAMGDILARDPYFNETIYAKYNSTEVFNNQKIDTRELSWLDTHNWTIRVGYLEGNLPYVDKGPGDGIRGIITAMFAKMEARGIHIAYHGYPTIDSLSSAMDNHLVDICIPMFREFWFAEQREVIMSEPVAVTSMALVYQKGSGDGEPQNLAVANNSALQKGYAGLYFPDVAQTIYRSIPECMEAVAQNKTQWTLIPATTYNLYRNGKGMENLQYRELSYPLEVCFYAHRENTRLITLIDKNIQLSASEMQGFALSEYSYSAPSYSLLEMLRRNATPVLTVIMVAIFAMAAALYSYRASRRKVEDISRDNEELSAHAYKDGLTNVGNRFSFLKKRAEMEKQVASPSREPFGVVIVDVNNLKKTNDHWGHESGDRLIQNTCHKVCEIFDHSPVYRIGGDEFVVLLKGRDYEDRDILIERLAQDNTPIYDMLKLSQGKSYFAYGMSTLKSTDRDFADVFDRADRNMYECKKNMKAER